MNRKRLWGAYIATAVSQIRRSIHFSPESFNIRLSPSVSQFAYNGVTREAKVA